MRGVVVAVCLASSTALAQTPPDADKAIAEETSQPAPPANPSPPSPPAKIIASPIRVALDCQEPGRTKTCPSFLLAIIEANPVLISSPRAGADVVVYVNTVEVANTDKVQLRFVGDMPGAPRVIEIEVEIDTRATDDAQRAQVEPSFVRGLALYVAARHPDAVDVKLLAPQGGVRTKEQGSPFGASLSVNGNGSYTNKYRSAGGESVLSLQYIKRDFRMASVSFLNGSLQRQPSLRADDGSIIKLDSNQWSARTGAEVVYSYDDCWSFGASSYHALEDDKAQTRWNSRNRAAVAYNFFAPDDPRGNKLEFFYHAGIALERYNLPNVLGEKFAAYPVHGIDASGSVRHDKIQYGINMESDIQMNRPGRRYQLTASPFVAFQIGAHVDLSLNYSLTKRELPAPDPNSIDPSDYEQISRLSYAEPLAMSGSIGLTIHLDPTNGARNNRMPSI
ncbi:MAG TPA: hypothetical protein VGM90_30620 [Kofleriaceae bacterium]